MTDNTNTFLVEKALALLRVGAILVPDHPQTSPCGQPKPPTAADWSACWCDIGVLTDGIPVENPRHLAIVAILARCDAAFERGDWPALQRAASALKATVLWMNSQRPQNE